MKHALRDLSKQGKWNLHCQGPTFSHQRPTFIPNMMTSEKHLGREIGSGFHKSVKELLVDDVPVVSIENCKG